ncbi:MAG: hypothetical protein ACTSUE_26340 [Promethearchaeota archaeon]
MVAQEYDFDYDTIGYPPDIAGCEFNSGNIGLGNEQWDLSDVCMDPPTSDQQVVAIMQEMCNYYGLGVCQAWTAFEEVESGVHIRYVASLIGGYEPPEVTGQLITVFDVVQEGFEEGSHAFSQFFIEGGIMLATGTFYSESHFVSYNPFLPENDWPSAQGCEFTTADEFFEAVLPDNGMFRAFRLEGSCEHDKVDTHPHRRATAQEMCDSLPQCIFWQLANVGSLLVTPDLALFPATQHLVVLHTNESIQGLSFFQNAFYNNPEPIYDEDQTELGFSCFLGTGTHLPPPEPTCDPSNTIQTNFISTTGLTLGNFDFESFGYPPPGLVPGCVFDETTRTLPEVVVGEVYNFNLTQACESPDLYNTTNKREAIASAVCESYTEGCLGAMVLRISPSEPDWLLKLRPTVFIMEDSQFVSVYVQFAQMSSYWNVPNGGVLDNTYFIPFGYGPFVENIPNRDAIDFYNVGMPKAANCTFYHFATEVEFVLSGGSVPRMFDLYDSCDSRRTKDEDSMREIAQEMCFSLTDCEWWTLYPPGAFWQTSTFSPVQSYFVGLFRSAHHGFIVEHRGVDPDPVLENSVSGVRCDPRPFHYGLPPSQTQKCDKFTTVDHINLYINTQHVTFHFDRYGFPPPFGACIFNESSLLPFGEPDFSIDLSVACTNNFDDLVTEEDRADLVEHVCGYYGPVCLSSAVTFDGSDKYMTVRPAYFSIYEMQEFAGPPNDQGTFQFPGGVAHHVYAEIIESDTLSDIDYETVGYPDICNCSFTSVVELEMRGSGEGVFAFRMSDCIPERVDGYDLMVEVAQQACFQVDECVAWAMFGPNQVISQVAPFEKEEGVVFALYTGFIGEFYLFSESSVMDLGFEYEDGPLVFENNAFGFKCDLGPNTCLTPRPTLSPTPHPTFDECTTTYYTDPVPYGFDATYTSVNTSELPFPPDFQGCVFETFSSVVTGLISFTLNYNCPAISFDTPEKLEAIRKHVCDFYDGITGCFGVMTFGSEAPEFGQFVNYDVVVFHEDPGTGEVLELGDFIADTIDHALQFKVENGVANHVMFAPDDNIESYMIDYTLVGFPYACGCEFEYTEEFDSLTVFRLQSSCFYDRVDTHPKRIQVVKEMCQSLPSCKGASLFPRNAFSAIHPEFGEFYINDHVVILYTEPMFPGTFLGEPVFFSALEAAYIHGCSVEEDCSAVPNMCGDPSFTHLETQLRFPEPVDTYTFPPPTTLVSGCNFTTDNIDFTMFEIFVDTCEDSQVYEDPFQFEQLARDLCSYYKQNCTAFMGTKDDDDYLIQLSPPLDAIDELEFTWEGDGSAEYPDTRFFTQLHFYERYWNHTLYLPLTDSLLDPIDYALSGMPQACGCTFLNLYPGAEIGGDRIDVFSLNDACNLNILKNHEDRVNIAIQACASIPECRFWSLYPGEYFIESVDSMLEDKYFIHLSRDLSVEGGLFVIDSTLPRYQELAVGVSCYDVDLQVCPPSPLQECLLDAETPTLSVASIEEDADDLSVFGFPLHNAFSACNLHPDYYTSTPFFDFAYNLSAACEPGSFDTQEQQAAIIDAVCEFYGTERCMAGSITRIHYPGPGENVYLILADWHLDTGNFYNLNTTLLDPMTFGGSTSKMYLPGGVLHHVFPAPDHPLGIEYEDFIDEFPEACNCTFDASTRSLMFVNTGVSAVFAGYKLQTACSNNKVDDYDWRVLTAQQMCESVSDCLLWIMFRKGSPVLEFDGDLDPGNTPVDDHVVVLMTNPQATVYLSRYLASFPEVSDFRQGSAMGLRCSLEEGVECSPPTVSPTPNPTTSPTPPTLFPTLSPSVSPSVSPTVSPTPPTLFPTLSPSVSPTASPTLNPTASPTFPALNLFLSATEIRGDNVDAYSCLNRATELTLNGVTPLDSVCDTYHKLVTTQASGLEVETATEVSGSGVLGSAINAASVVQDLNGSTFGDWTTWVTGMNSDDMMVGEYGLGDISGLSHLYWWSGSSTAEGQGIQTAGTCGTYWDSLSTTFGTGQPGGYCVSGSGLASMGNLGRCGTNQDLGFGNNGNDQASADTHCELIDPSYNCLPVGTTGTLSSTSSGRIRNAGFACDTDTYTGRDMYVLCGCYDSGL